MLKIYDFDKLLQTAFNKTYNAVNFLHVWAYMNDYLNFERSSDLSKYFMYSKSVTFSF